MKKIWISCFSLLLLFSLVWGMVGCGPAETEEELLEKARELTEESAKLNEIVFGAGILPLEGGYELGAYTEADPDSLAHYGVESVTDIELYIGSIYTKATALWIKNTVLTSTKAESQALTYARYYDGNKQMGSDSVPVLMVRTNHEPVATGKVSYQNYRIVEAKRDEVVFLVDMQVTDGEMKRDLPDERITMRKEKGIWRLDTTTYADVK